MFGVRIVLLPLLLCIAISLLQSFAEESADGDCPELDCSTSCPWGWVTVAVKGSCPECRCKRMACPKFGCTLDCEFGHKIGRDDCPVCACRSAPCRDDAKCSGGQGHCLDGYVIKHGCRQCRCRTFRCAHLRLEHCPQTCQNGYAVNEYGCHTCTCLPIVCQNISQTCTLDCELGYKTDTFGCDKCDCKTKACQNETLGCDFCTHGRYYDSNGCETCRCLGKSTGLYGMELLKIGGDED